MKQMQLIAPAAIVAGALAFAGCRDDAEDEALAPAAQSADVPAGVAGQYEAIEQEVDGGA